MFHCLEDESCKASGFLADKSKVLDLNRGRWIAVQWMCLNLLKHNHSDSLDFWSASFVLFKALSILVSVLYSY